MNKSFSIRQLQKTSNLDANLSSRQYKLNLMGEFMRDKYENPKLKQSEIANRLGKSYSTLRRHRNDINMLSPYRINPNNTNKRTQKAKILFLTTIHIANTTSKDLNWPQMTSRRSQTNQLLKRIKKNKLKGGAINEIIEKYLNEIVHNKYLYMDLAIQIITNDKPVRSDTVQDLK